MSSVHLNLPVFSKTAFSKWNSRRAIKKPPPYNPVNSHNISTPEVITTEKSNILLRHFEKKNEQKLDLGSVKPNAIKRSAAEALQQETLDNGVNSSLYSELSPKPKNRRLAQQQASNSTVEIALTSAGSSGASDDTQPTGRQHAPAKASSSKM